MSHEDLKDKALMARVARGDHQAFRGLVLRHQRVVHAIAYRYLGDPADAEEIAQEAFCRLYAAAGRYRPEASFRTYLLRIVTNLCANRRARAYRTQEESRDPAVMDEGQAGSPGGDPRDRLLEAERAEAVRRAVLALPADQRIAMILFRFEGLSYEEIADSTGKSVASVTSALWRARGALRDSLAGWVAPPQDSSPPPVATGRSKPT